MLKYLYSVSQYSFNLKHEEKLPAWHVHIAQAHPSLQSSHRTLSDSTHFLFILGHEALSPSQGITKFTGSYQYHNVVIQPSRANLKKHPGKNIHLSSKPNSGHQVV